MKLAEIVLQPAVLPELRASERDALLEELLDAVIDAGAVDAQHKATLLDRLIQREQRSSTGFGRGVAVPHVKHPAITRLAAGIGLSPQGVDFDALDKQPVYSFIILLSPEDKPEEHLQAMEAVFKNLSNESFRRALRQARSVDEVMTLIEDSDSQQLAG